MFAGACFRWSSARPRDCPSISPFVWPPVRSPVCHVVHPLPPMCIWLAKFISQFDKRALLSTTCISNIRAHCWLWCSSFTVHNQKSPHTLRFVVAVSKVPTSKSQQHTYICVQSRHSEATITTWLPNKIIPEVIVPTCLIVQCMTFWAPRTIARKRTHVTSSWIFTMFEYL